MDATNATRRKNLDAGAVGQNHGAGHGGGPIFAQSQHQRQVAAAAFTHVLPGAAGQVVKLVGAQANVNVALDDGYCRRNGPTLTNGRFHRDGRFQVIGKRQPVGNHRTFQRYHRPAFRQRCRYVWLNMKIIQNCGHPSP